MARMVGGTKALRLRLRFHDPVRHPGSPDGQALDSNNLLPLLTGEGRFLRREFFLQQAGSEYEMMFRRMPWKLVIQSNHLRTKYEPKALYNLKDDPEESRDYLQNLEFRPVVERLLAEHMAVMKSGRPTAPGRR